MRKASGQCAAVVIVAALTLFSPLSSAPTVAAPLTVYDHRPNVQDAAATAVEHVRLAVRRAVESVKPSLTIEPAVDAALSVEEDPDWSLFSAGDATIWLPDTFVGGSLDEDLPLIADALRSQGGEYAALADMIEQNPSLFQLFAIEPTRSESGVLTNVNITRETVLSAIDSETYLGIIETDLPRQFEILERERVEMDGLEDASRAIISVAMPGAVRMKQAIYVVKGDGNTMWTITYTAGESEFDDMLSAFERSAMSFTLTSD